MRDRDGWDGWDDRDDRDVPPGGKPPKGGNGWLIGLVVGGVILLAAGGVALVVLLDNDPPPPVAFANPPGGFGPGGIGPGGPAGPGQPPPDWTPADADVRRDVRDALRALGRDLQKPDFDPTARFAVEALATAGIDALSVEAGWGNRVLVPAPGDPPIDAAGTTRTYLKDRRREWRRLAWADADIRLVTVSRGGTVARAMTWQKPPAGPLVKTLWTFVRDPDDRWVVSDWEELATGLRGSDEIAVALLQRYERRWDLHVFRRLADIHAATDDGRYDDARTSLAHLFRTRPVAAFADMGDMAEAKLLVRQYGVARAADILDAMSARWVDRPCMLRLRAEVANAADNWPVALEACEIFLRLYGNDPDIQAQYAAALLATDRAAEARPHVAAALADDPDHALALDALRRLRDTPKDEAFIRATRASNRFPALFPTLARMAAADRDWPALVQLAEEFVARRPEDAAGPETLVRALAESGDTAAAVRAFARHAGPVSTEARAGMVNAVAAPAVRAGKAAELYAALADEHRDEFFLRLARDLDLMSDRFKARDDELDDRKAREQLVALVAAHAGHRPGQGAVRLYEAKELIRDEKWEAAEKKLAAIAVPPAAAMEYESLAWLVRDAKLDVFHALKKWGTALDEVTPAGVAFGRLAARSEDAKQWDDLAALLAAYKKKSPDPVELAYWTGTLLAAKGKHADAMVEFKKVTTADKPAAEEADDDDRPGPAAARTRFARSAVKAGRAADAVAALEADDFPPAALFAYAVASAGDTVRAVRFLEGLLADEPYLLGVLYADPDLGQLLEKPAFDDFRAKHPKPLPRAGGLDEE